MVLPNIFILGSYFDSNRSAEAVMGVGADFIGLTKINTNGFYKYTNEKLEKYWPGGSDLVFKSNLVVPGDSIILDIGHKYNSMEFLSFIETDREGLKKLSPIYLSNLTILLIFLFKLLFILG